MDNNLRIKPIPAIKSLQTKEKLIAIDGNIVEAKKIRKELTKIETSEIQRIKNDIDLSNKNKYKKLELKQQFELNHLLCQHEKKKTKLLQKYNLEKILLTKTIKIRMNEFMNNQRLSSVFAEKNVQNKDSIAQLKDMSYKKQIILKNSKTVDSINKLKRTFGTVSSLTFNNASSQISSIKGVIKNLKIDKSKLPSFHINSKSYNKRESTLTTKNNEILNATLKNIEEFDNKNMIGSLCALYNKRLEPIK